MDLTQTVQSAEWVWYSWMLMSGLLVIALWLAPWDKVCGDNSAQNIYLGTIVVLSLVWLIRADLPTGINFHLLGASFMCLLFEWQFALLAMLLVMLTQSIAIGVPVENLALNWFSLGFVPIMFCRVTLYLVQRYMPHNFYVYVFMNTFFASGFSVYIAGSVSALFMYYLFELSSHLVFDQFLVTLILMILPEAVCTGMLMTILVVYKPAWVATFHDRWYLINR